ncbi:MAG: single-stranded-DNA-specific exonuclease RecJ [Calditrichaceae bacterium]|nr:single-stranded-DNA-specific exonuclease RecJ [Calditrichaceae bacterium]MBN2708332.1 single-stranded-DNA-specific exonuclease RecJ [Calditrichaceae bacterium]RQV95221.1 MAG: single-stranded-DNA-specific exonuclease RecJ [Calditrichota bacterium]
MFPRKRWRILNTDPTRSIVDVLLENRNLPADHLEPFKLSDKMHSPYLLPDMEIGVARVLRAIEKGEKICIFGDYDVDGITSTALMIYFFRKINYPVTWNLPHREKNGYGLRASTVDQIAKTGTNLIITVDNGISAHEAINHASELGIDVVVTDHHLQEGDLPNSAAVINPNRTDSQYPFKTICGAVVAFKFIYAISEKLMAEEDVKQFLLDQLDLVCIGTIADVMPLRDENYALVKFGLKVLTKTKKPGLIELKNIAGVNQKTITPISVGFFLAPRLNASGRIEEADIGLELLISESHENAYKTAAYLNELNRKRQKLQSGYLQEALAQLSKDETDIDKAIIVERLNWQAGLIGLISSQLKEKYARPVIAFTQDEEGNYVGSARSIDDFHITNALTRFSQYFINYGGHRKAAGLTVYREKYEIFKKEFMAYVNETLQNNHLSPELVIDSIVDIDQINLNNARTIQDIGPFGETNPEPVFLLKNALIREIIPMSNGKHLKIYIQKSSQIYEAVWWNSGDLKNEFFFGGVIDIACKININIWRGTDRLQLIIEDIAIH